MGLAALISGLRRSSSSGADFEGAEIEGGRITFALLGVGRETLLGACVPGGGVEEARLGRTTTPDQKKDEEEEAGWSEGRRGRVEKWVSLVE